MLVKQADKITGKLSQPSKMPGYSYNLPAKECKKGRLLREVPGSVCFGCYAMKGRYLWPNTIKAMYRRLRSLSDPRWTEAMAFLINRRSEQGNDCFRWNDSGDLQSVNHLRQIVKVCKLTPGVMHWLPTREYKIVRDYLGEIPGNLIIRLSGHMIDGKAPEFGYLTSTVTNLYNPGLYIQHLCPAPEQDGECKSCRMCWDANIKSIAYRAH